MEKVYEVLNKYPQIRAKIPKLRAKITEEDKKSSK
jgi:hypothetical protein